MNIKILLKTISLIVVITILLVGSVINNAFAQESDSEINEFCGRYGGVRTIGIKNGNLYLQRDGGSVIELNKIDEDLYKPVTPPGMRPIPNVQFVRTDKGKVKGLQFIHTDGRKENFVSKDVNEKIKVKKDPVTEAEKKQLIANLSETLIERYVFPDIAKKYASMLESNQESGKYREITNKTDLASAITTDLNSLNPDGHLRITTKESFEKMNKEQEKMRKRIQDVEKGEGKIEETFMHGKILDANIGYVKITSFPCSKDAQKHAHNVMKSIKDCNAIIFDLNENRGGCIPVIDIIASYLFAKPTHIVSSMSTFENDGKEKKHISKPNELSKIMAEVPVYVLTSNMTGSAGEHFALIFKSTGRGELIGQATFGIAHFAGWEPLSENFVGMIPFGRTYDPETGKDWEGVGIIPDIEMNPSESLNWVLEKIKD